MIRFSSSPAILSESGRQLDNLQLGVIAQKFSFVMGSKILYDGFMEKTKKMPVILSVAVPSPLRKALDYLAPNEEGHTFQPGQRWTVPLGSRKVIGVLVEVKSHSDCERAQLKSALVCHDAESLWPAPLWQLCCFAAEYYRYPLGAAFAEILPMGLKQGSDATLEPIVSYQVTNEGRASLATPFNHASKQRLLLELIAEKGSVEKEKLTGKSAVLKRLILKSQVETVSQLPVMWQYEKIPPSLTLTNEQQVVVEVIEQSVGFHAFLLWGVTGSGKTEVYFRVMQSCLAQGKQVLFLVPEIALTPQTLSRIEQAFSVPVVAYHSGLTDKNRLNAWKMARSGLAAIVVGTRSAIFLPLKNPGMIVIDEEHDASYKQQNGFRYNARDCAVRRAQLEGVPLILGSATPSLRTYHNALKGRYTLLRLTQSAVALHPAKRRCLQLSARDYQQGISDEVKKIMEVHLKNKKQVLLFLNRRGFAPLYFCPSCEYIAQCHQCDANLTYHKKKHSLICHHCNSKTRAMKDCPSCARAEMIAYGLGTEQLEQTAQALFPLNRVLRMDRDTTVKRGELEKQLKSVVSGEAEIIIGTQMLAKGHHFPNLTCVIVVNADQGFLSSDFRSAEQTAALLEQVSGRAGRELHVGEVVFQTLQSDNPYLKTLLKEGYLVLAKQLLEEREEAGLPPSTALALLAAESKHIGEAERFLLSICEQFRKKGWEWIGPMPALLAKRANWYRFQLGLLSATPSVLQEQLQQLIARLDLIENSRIRWFLDVDPYTMM